ncbi:alkane 1-monooxygenase, partial [Enterobacter asburiae]
ICIIDRLNSLHEPWGIDSFIFVTPLAEGATLVASLRLLAEARLNKEVTV